MTWGALNNHREKTASEPLPDFLTGQGNKGIKDRQDPQFQTADDVIVYKTERSQGARKDAGRGYGVAYPGGINIQMSKKTLFVSLVFFVTIIIMTFCIGYLAGNLAVTISTPEATSLAPSKKPIIPVRKKAKQEKKLEKAPQTFPHTHVPAQAPEIEEDFSPLDDSQQNTETVSSKNNKNDKDTNSELLYKTAPTAEDSDDMDD